LVVATDAEGLAPLPCWSDSHAYELTATVRAAAAAIQDAALVVERNADKTMRQIADEPAFRALPFRPNFRTADENIGIYQLRPLLSHGSKTTIFDPKFGRRIAWVVSLSTTQTQTAGWLVIISRLGRSA
jgi:hypothetical protein